MNTLSNLIATYTSLGFWGSILTSAAGQGLVPAPRKQLNVAAAYCVHELPPSVLIHTPPLAAPTKRRPGVVGSAAIALIRPVALNVAPTNTPPKFDEAFSIGWGPIKFHVGRLVLVPAACAAAITRICTAAITRICTAALPYAPVGTPN